MDDETMILQVAKEMIEVLGHQVESTENGADAVEKFRQAKAAGRPFDVVILDLTVKAGMGGEKAIRILREIDPEVKAIVSSGYSDNAVVSDHKAYGFAAFLNKPYTIEALRDCIDSLLA
ncbi:MAG: response regulator [Nitrospiraceae bacterium]|nr:response regulator [Nitrospiraceae bacterium]